ncbi:hypothetical protein NEF87_000322 [Candidatus Lokiarchaeum ossiferum]|uniref:Spermatogenesis-associated protein 20-like TRX domain-containing protein n=1 Tax=Candidatus Lokiarchaeum ossiferum TaxID=2951803 RepID=A0ABY6HMC4_9ARCH|nr:hypothetical protein NEF87_000322 [Candidatus Lokiarchaeum sp. B-35]
MNQLQFETSPYLKQHAENPVNWVSYSSSAIKRAMSEKKLIFLSIGYSSCHWCHVMAHESFEDPKIAKILNHHFISIKIDREERPDIDHVYQTLGQVMGVQGGWPLSVFLTPNNKPMYVGTYFPKQTNFGRIGFEELLHKLVAIYKSQPQEIEEQGIKILSYVENIFKRSNGKEKSDVKLNEINYSPQIEKILTKIQQNFDEIHGGFGKSPKFPNFPTYVFLLRELNSIKNSLPSLHADLKRNILHSLRKMASGGIYDHIGGGFHRYSVDAKWTIPHFEKMLYDNAMALVAYSEAYLYFKEPEFKAIVKEIIFWIQSEMKDPSGGFFSAMDADSEGKEGKYYGWSISELKALLDEQEQEEFFEKYNISVQGNFDNNLNILTVKQSNSNKTRDVESNSVDLEENMQLTKIKEKLLHHRSNRISPSKDSKVISSWNGLLLHGLFSAHRIFEDEEYGSKILQMTAKLFGFFEENIVNYATGQMFRIFTESQAKIPGNLDDYAYFIQGILDRYSIFYQHSDFALLELLMKYVINNFYDYESKTFFYTDHTVNDISIRPIKEMDMPLPSPSAIMAENLLRYHYFFHNEDFHLIANSIISRQFEMAENHPDFSSSLLMAFQLARNGFDELTVLIDNTNANSKKEIKKMLREFYIPFLVTYFGSENASISRLKEKSHLPGAPFTAFLCHNFICANPTQSLEGIKALLHNYY